MVANSDSYSQWAADYVIDGDLNNYFMAINLEVLGYNIRCRMAFVFGLVA